MRDFPILQPQIDRQQQELKASGVDPVFWVPWELIAAHAKQCERNHGQTPQQLARRGGLSASEAVAVIEDRVWTAMPIGEANSQL